MFHLARQRSRDHAAGFTLLEALVAVVVLSVVMTFSLPSLARGLRAHAMTSSTRIASSHLRLVRSTAIARGARARLVVVDGTGLATDVFENGSWTRVGRGTTLDGGVVVAQVTPGVGIVFEREGTSFAPGVVTLANASGGERRITVSVLGSIGVAP